jgi:hypothetical protein
MTFVNSKPKTASLVVHESSDVEAFANLAGFHRTMNHLRLN